MSTYKDDLIRAKEREDEKLSLLEEKSSERFIDLAKEIEKLIQDFEANSTADLSEVQASAKEALTGMSQNVQGSIDGVRQDLVRAANDVATKVASDLNRYLSRRSL